MGFFYFLALLAVGIHLSCDILFRKSKIGYLSKLSLSFAVAMLIGMFVVYFSMTPGEKFWGEDFEREKLLGTLLFMVLTGVGIAIANVLLKSWMHGRTFVMLKRTCTGNQKNHATSRKGTYGTLKVTRSRRKRKL